MNRLIISMALLLVFIAPQAWGAKSPYPNPNRQTTWNNLTDGIHTLGQTPQQAKLTKMKLHKARARTRLRNISQANRAKLIAKRKAWANSQIQQQ